MSLHIQWSPLYGNSSPGVKFQIPWPENLIGPAGVGISPGLVSLPVRQGWGQVGEDGDTGV